MDDQPSDALRIARLEGHVKELQEKMQELCQHVTGAGMEWKDVPSIWRITVKDNETGETFTHTAGFDGIHPTKVELEELLDANYMRDDDGELAVTIEETERLKP